MSNEFVARNGLIALDNSIVTGSLNVTNGITGSLLGTASFATTASFALNAGGAAASSNLIFSGSVTASVDVTANTFRLISGSSTFLYVSSSGRVGLNTTTPTAQLDIRKSAQAVPNIVLSGPNNYDGGNFKGLGITNYYSDVTTTNRQLAIYNTDNTNYPYLRVAIANLNYVGIDAITGSTSFAKDLYLGNAIYITSGSNVGIGTTVPAAKLQVSGTVNVANIRGSGSATTQSIFTVDGAAGRLFSVNDSLSGSLFSVNTIAGLPVIEAFSDNTVRIGQYGQRVLFISQSRVGINKETTLNANIDISGSAVITGSLNITGSITSTGTITAQTLVVQTVTSSVSWITGSSKFGNLITDTHQFTGSISVSGSITGTNGVTNDLTASWASNVTSASYAISSSNAISSSYAITASNAVTASYAPLTRYALQFSAIALANFTWGDGTLYYIGNGIPMAQFSNQGRAEVYVPKAGTITAAYVYASFSTAGSNQAWSMSILINGTTATTIQSISVGTATRTWSNTALSIAVAAGDHIEIRSDAVTWTTNPVSNTGYGVNATIYIE